MPNKDVEAQQLADYHYGAEPAITQIFRLLGEGDTESQPDEPIKLLQVNQPASPAGILPIGSRPMPKRGFHFPMVIVEIAPEEMERIRGCELSLPHGWRVGELIPKSCANGKR